MKERTPK